MKHYLIAPDACKCIHFKCGIQTAPLIIVSACVVKCVYYATIKV